MLWLFRLSWNLEFKQSDIFLTKRILNELSKLGWISTSGINKNLWLGVWASEVVYVTIDLSVDAGFV